VIFNPQGKYPARSACPVFYFSGASVMFLLMNIFHGRTWNEDQKQSYLGDSGWGSQGPKLDVIQTMRYQDGNLLLFYSSPDRLVQASTETGWAIIGVPPFRALDNCLLAPFPKGHDDLLGCYSKASHGMIYYGDFNLNTLDHRPMVMCLKMEKNYARDFPAKKRELILEQITDLHFTYGTYTVWFDSIAACQKAKVLTGWRNGVDDICLDLPVSAIRNAVQVQSNHSQNVLLRYESFELSAT
jgi:hypothetical protein